MSFYFVLEESVEHLGLGEVVTVFAGYENLRRDDFLQVRTQVWMTVGVTEKQQTAQKFLGDRKDRRVRFLKSHKGEKCSL